MLKYSTFEKKKQHFYKISLPVHVLLILKTESFEGTLMSDSITMEKEYQQAMEKINELLKEQETKQKSEEEKIAEKYAEMNQTPWPEEALAGIPKACDLVYEFYDWKDEDGYASIKVFMSQSEAEAYFAKLKDLVISPDGARRDNELIWVKGAGDGFTLSCTYDTHMNILSITYYYQ